MKKLIALLLFSYFMISTMAQSAKEIMYVGTFSIRGSEGIYVYTFDRNKETFQLIQTVKTLESPSFLAIHPSGKVLYSVNRGAVPERNNSGSVSAYTIDPSSGKLTLLNHKPSYGNGPCHISTDYTGKLAFISNYSEGNLAVIHLASDGSLGECADTIRFSGNGSNKQRQDKPHVHSATPSPDNRFLLVADLGTDKMYSFSINTSSGRLTPGQTPYTEVKHGSGPRHFTFHPKGKYAYLAEELTSSVCAFKYNKETGALEAIQDQIASLPNDFTGINTSADIHTDPSGKYLLMSNRGHQSVAIYTIRTNGTLTLKENINTKGEKPRNFLIDQENEYVFVAHQDTDNIVVFRWDPKKGKLTDTGVQVKVPSPVCLKMLKLN